MLERFNTSVSADLAAFSVDRDLPVPLGTQLRGLIEFGVGLGSLRAGDRLPSVREMADHLGVAPMTVAQVYADLKAAGLIVTKAGSGSFVAEIAFARRRRPAPHGFALHRALDAVIQQGRVLGLRTSDLAGLLAARMAEPCDKPRVVVVGHFVSATAAYCTEMAQVVGDAVTIEPATLGTIEEDAHARQRAARADLVITFAHRRHDVMALLPNTAVAAVTFIPAAATRQALAALDPRARVGLVSIFPEFTPLMKAGVRRFAPHVSAVSIALYGSPEFALMLHRVDVVVFATGADDLGLVVPDGVAAIEYRHTPDAGDVHRLIGPLYGDDSRESKEDMP
ncbi:GntR family transcriptional regulator [Lichenicoccus sp.]|uniref:GntR family transcriptional regulator n=1 Tax=Lichenicoccus sp. TaxID=2781899 RepID=UPI003D098A22